MPDDAGRDSAFYDHENEPRRHVADWGGDELFTRMPRRRQVHASTPRFRRTGPIDPLHRPTPPENRGRPEHGGAPRYRLEDEPFPEVGDSWGSPRVNDVRPAPGGPRFHRDDRNIPGLADASGAPRFSRDDRAVRDVGEPSRAPRFHREDAPVRDVGESSGAPRFHREDAPARGGGAPSDVPRFRADDGLSPSGGDRSVHARSSGGAGEPGRRTVVIAGRPDDGLRPGPRRYGRPMTVAERVGPRPERIVAWAFALGLLLILIAIATADAATL